MWYGKNPVNSTGSSGIIYELDDKYVKYSDLPTETTKLFPKKYVFCNNITLKLNKSINENCNSLRYAVNYVTLTNVIY